MVKDESLSVCLRHPNLLSSCGFSDITSSKCVNVVEDTGNAIEFRRLDVDDDTSFLELLPFDRLLTLICEN
ncbi:hypothetical protein Hanom_Chr12g01066001 [Helianthus anomalus]